MIRRLMRLRPQPLSPHENRWLDSPKNDKLISYAYMQGHHAKLPGKQDGEDKAFPKDQYYNPPEAEPLNVKVLRESAEERIKLR